jgi:succinate dehydrogenase / fumarate reductase cytochrome b subunit
LRSFALARRILSLSGVVPLGVFLLVHVVTNARALRGPAAFERAVAFWARLPGLRALEALVIFAPLVAHAAVGTWLVVTRRPMAEPSPYPPPVRIAVRATAVAALLFLALHLPELRLRAHAGPPPDGGVLRTILEAKLSSTSHGVPWRALAYLAGSACVVFHFAAGLWGSFARTARGSEARARRVAAWSAGALGAVLWLLLADVVVLHATGARLLGLPAPAPDAAAQTCPPGR